MFLCLNLTRQAERIRVSVKTLQRWDAAGKLPAKRTLSGHRFYTEDDLLIAQGLKTVEAKRKVVVYCRVSSGGQKPELKNQISAMETFCLNRGLAVDDWVSEIGGGLNFKRKKFLSIMMSMLKGEISTIVVAHKDRMCRFAFEFIQELASNVGCEIVVANQESLSPQQELVASRGFDGNHPLFFLSALRIKELFQGNKGKSEESH